MTIGSLATPTRLATSSRSPQAPAQPQDTVTRGGGDDYGVMTFGVHMFEGGLVGGATGGIGGAVGGAFLGAALGPIGSGLGALIGGIAGIVIGGCVGAGIATRHDV